MAAGSNLPPIIIKRNGKRGHGDAFHGSTTWKIALADFMTAMFIIFLCLWLINQVTPEQRTGIADYFSPAAPSRTTSGSGGILGGTSIMVPGALKSESAPVSPIRGGGPSVPQEGEGTTQVPGYPGSTMALRGDKPGGERGGPGKGEARTSFGQNPAEGARFKQVENALTGIAGLAGVTDKINVTVQPVEEGLRILLVDSDKRELFKSGSAQPLPQTRELMTQVAKIIGTIPNKIAIDGYTDGTPFGRSDNYTNWELSSDRANASRRLLTEAGIPDDRVARVTGRADHDLLIPSDPTAPGNRRISITLLREKTANEQAAAAEAAAVSDNTETSNVPARPGPGPAPEGRLIPRTAAEPK